MNERIILVSLFNQSALEKINNIIKVINEPLCEVPFGKNENNRIKSESLSYHFILSTWNINQENFIL